MCERILSTLSTFFSNSKKSMALLDANIDIIDSNNPLTRKYITKLANIDACQALSEPTRGSKCLDHIISKGIDIYQVVAQETTINTDHKMITAKFGHQNQSTKTAIEKLVLSRSEANQISFAVSDYCNLEEDTMRDKISPSTLNNETQDKQMKNHSKSNMVNRGNKILTKNNGNSSSTIPFVEDHINKESYDGCSGQNRTWSFPMPITM